MRGTLVIRARILGVLFIAIALLLSVRLYFLQIVNGSDYAQDAKGQYQEAAPETEARGAIYFTTKDGGLVSAAVMQAGWRVAVTPKDIVDPEQVYAQLSALTPVDRDRFAVSAAKSADPYEEVAFRVSDSAATKIRSLKIPGVLLVQDTWRSYPAGELAAQTVGFVAFQGAGTTKTGVYGLERSWQDTLNETTSGMYVNPFAEIFANVRSALSSDPASQQGDIVTSIEPTVQTQLENTLDGVVKTYTPRLVGGIIMDPRTGEIFAIGSRPAFDPNTYNTVSNPAVYSNQLVEGRYEMGSIMKALTMAAGIDSGAVTPASTYKRQFLYDLWGAAVNTASRLESHGVAGRVQISEATRSRLGDPFLFEERGMIDDKDMGELRTWFLTGRSGASSE